jgi:hypothetical protein
VAVDLTALEESGQGELIDGTRQGPPESGQFLKSRDTGGRQD